MASRRKDERADAFALDGPPVSRNNFPPGLETPFSPPSFSVSLFSSLARPGE